MEMSSMDLCEFAGVTYRQLDYWCRAGFIRGHAKGLGSGSQRRFDKGAIADVFAVKTRMDDIEGARAELMAMRQRNYPRGIPDRRRRGDRSVRTVDDWRSRSIA